MSAPPPDRFAYRQAKELRLEFAMWLVAWDRYALAAGMTNQMTYAQAMSHKCVVTEVCPQAPQLAYESRSAVSVRLHAWLSRRIRNL